MLTHDDGQKQIAIGHIGDSSAIRNRSHYHIIVQCAIIFLNTGYQ